jgi:hypothetical protein
VTVCIVYSEYQLPKWTEYRKENCIFFINTTKTDGETHDLPLLQFKYQIGVFLAYDSGEKDDNTTVTLTLTGSECTGPRYWDGGKCVDATVVTTNETFSGIFTSGETKFWTYMAGPGLGHLTLQMIKTEGISADESQIKARYAGGTAVSHDKVDPNGTLTIISPRQGLWVFFVSLSQRSARGQGYIPVD